MNGNRGAGSTFQTELREGSMQCTSQDKQGDPGGWSGVTRVRRGMGGRKG